MEYTFEEEKKILRYELRHYKQYIAKRDRYQEKLDKAKRKMEPASPPMRSDAPRTRGSISHDMKLADHMTEIAEIEARIKYYQDRIDWVDYVLDTMSKGVGKVLIIEWYINREPIGHVYGRTHEKRIVDRYLEENLTDEMFERYSRLQKDIEITDPESEDPGE